MPAVEVMSPTFQMDKQCTVREAEAFKVALTAAEDSSGDFIVDASSVERIDTAGLQLLLGFAARLKLMDRRLVWQGVSPAVRQGAAQLGLGSALGLTEAA
jgi:anti-anti-sigma regulatory factor